MIKYGILGTGNIARQFAAGVLNCSRCQVAAVASRSADMANLFAKDYMIPIAHEGYEKILDHDDIDAIYIALPNHMHEEWAVKCLDAGKHVLCEKPIAVNLTQAQRMFEAAKENKKLLVEAYMYRAHPQTAEIVKIVRSGAIGAVKHIRTSFCFRVKNTTGNIRFNAKYAGGALMDIGGYCLTFSQLIANEKPKAVSAIGKLHKSGVDELTTGILGFDSGISGSFVCGMCLVADNSAMICGEEGYIHIPWPWKPGKASKFTISHGIPPKQDGKPAGPLQGDETREVHAGKELYAIEADAFAEMIEKQAPSFMPMEDTLTEMALMDEFRKMIGVQVP